MNEDISVLLLELYEKMGDYIAIQYAGSVAHKGGIKDEKKYLKKIPEFFTSVKRHISNAFEDKDKQVSLLSFSKK